MSTRYCNTLEIIGSDEQVNQVLEFCKSEPDTDGVCQLIDFNKILPLPKGFRMTESTPIGNSVYLYKDNGIIGFEEMKVQNIHSLDVNHFNQFPLPHLQFAGSRDLRYPYWGCFYEAYDQQIIDSNILSFSTINDEAYEVILKLSEIFIDIMFAYEVSNSYADNDELLFFKAGTVVKYFSYDYDEDRSVPRPERFTYSSKLEARLFEDRV